MGGLKYVLIARTALVLAAVFGYGAYASFHMHATAFELIVTLYCGGAAFLCLLAIFGSLAASYDEWSFQQWKFAQTTLCR